MGNRRQLLLCRETHIIDFAIECGWLHGFGYRLFDLSWQLHFSVWITTWPKPFMEEATRRNPTESLRLRLAEEEIFTTFYGDEFVQSLIGPAPTVNLASLMNSMKRIAVADPEQFSTPIVFLDS
jgi:hypothetical protein